MAEVSPPGRKFEVCPAKVIGRQQERHLNLPQRTNRAKIKAHSQEFLEGSGMGGAE